MREKPGLSNQQDISRDQSSSSLYIIPKEEITPLKLIGSGFFGIVEKISWNKNGVTRICARKTLNDLEKVHMLMEEFYNMIHLEDDNVVKLLGISKDGEKMSLIVEFCDGGSLKSRLDDRRKPKILVTVFKDYAYQIASGMNYLAGHGVLHNDLATRNILLTNNKQRVKIGDFGLARTIEENEQYYLKRSSTPVPIAWTAPEALLERKYTSLSDVYSYGVVLWEMFSYGARPSRMNHSSNENPFLDQPIACPCDIYVLMKKCWSFNSYSRPEFGEIKNYLSNSKIAIMEVSTDYGGEHDGEHFYFQKGDNVIVIRNIGEDRIYCQGVKSHQFGIISAEKLNFVADSATEKLYDHSYATPIQLSNIYEGSRFIPLPTRKALKLEASGSDTSTSFLNRLFGMKWLIILGIVIFCSLLSLTILAIWYRNPFAIAMSDVETTNYTSTVETTIYTPAVETTTYTPAVETITYTPAVEIITYSPAVETTIYTPAVETITYTPTVETITYTSAVETTTYTPTVETTAYIVPTEIISTITQTEVNSKYQCNYWLLIVIPSEEVTYLIDGNYNVFKIQNQRIVKKVSANNFFVQDFPFHSPGITAGYIRDGSLILFSWSWNDKVQVFVYDPIPMQSDKFKLREGFPKQTPIVYGSISGVIMINDKAHAFNNGNMHGIYDERSNTITTWMDLNIDFPNFPKDGHLRLQGGHTTSSNGQKFLTLFYYNLTNIINNSNSIVYTYDLERKNLVGGCKYYKEYLLNCE